MKEAGRLMVTPTGQQGPARLTMDDNDKRLDDYVLYVRPGLDPLNKLSRHQGTPTRKHRKAIGKDRKELGSCCLRLK